MLSQQNIQTKAKSRSIVGKTAKNIYLLILAILLTAENLFAGGNDQIKTVKYRVTAVSAADESVTSESNLTEVAYPVKLYIPNAFTPNDDGMNDVFKVVTGGMERFNLAIYNRWGAKLFESDNPAIPWDGTVEGNVVQEGVYVYQLNVLTYNKETLCYNGTVSVIK